jgi:hypothetical protein
MKLTLQQLEADLWGAANILRGKTAGQDYKNYILSLMFFKRLCDEWEYEADDAIAELERQQRRTFTEKGPGLGPAARAAPGERTRQADRGHGARARPDCGVAQCSAFCRERRGDIEPVLVKAAASRSVGSRQAFASFPCRTCLTLRRCVYS